MASEPRHWFGHKRFGAGFGPSSWQGWLVLLGYVVAIGLSGKVNREYGAAPAWALFALATLIFFFILIVKRDRGRPYRWRGGRLD